MQQAATDSRFHSVTQEVLVLIDNRGEALLQFVKEKWPCTKFDARCILVDILFFNLHLQVGNMQFCYLIQGNKNVGCKPSQLRVLQIPKKSFCCFVLSCCCSFYIDMLGLARHSHRGKNCVLPLQWLNVNLYTCFALKSLLSNSILIIIPNSLVLFLICLF